MNLAPGARFVDLVRAHLPCAFTEHLESARIDHPRDRPWARDARHFHRQRRLATRHGHVVGYGKGPSVPQHVRLHPSFARPVRKIKQGLEGQACLDRYLRVAPRFAAAFPRGGRPGFLDRLRVEPRREIVSIDPRSVLLGPVLHPIAILGSVQGVVFLLAFRQGLSHQLRCPTRAGRSVDDILMHQRLLYELIYVRSIHY